MAHHGRREKIFWAKKENTVRPSASRDTLIIDSEYLFRLPLETQGYTMTGMLFVSMQQPRTLKMCRCCKPAIWVPSVRNVVFCDADAWSTAQKKKTNVWQFSFLKKILSRLGGSGRRKNFREIYLQPFWWGPVLPAMYPDAGKVRNKCGQTCPRGWGSAMWCGIGELLSVSIVHHGRPWPGRTSWPVTRKRAPSDRMPWNGRRKSGERQKEIEIRFNLTTEITDAAEAEDLAMRWWLWAAGDLLECSDMGAGEVL